MDQEQQRREHLYKRFKENLSDGNPMDEFDENDLIDIYDYACDFDDEYVQFEVILLAARFYPECGELAQRKAYFLFDNLSMTSGVEDIVKKHKNENALWDILELLVKNQDKDTTIKAFDAIISTYDDFDDETIIQLVDAAVDLDLYEWLLKNKDLIKSKCQFPSTFLYEFSREAALRDDFQNRLALIEELTEIDPFSEMYWHMLAQTYVMLGNQEEAFQAIEYALAIDPASVESRITKAQILFDLNKDQKGALEMIRQIMSEDPDNPTACHTAVAMNLLMGNEREAKEIFCSYVHKFPDDQSSVERMFVFADSSFAISALRYYCRMSGLNEAEWAEWAKSYYDKEEYQHCSDILLAWLYEYGSLTDWKHLLESLYLQHRLDELTAVYGKYIRDKSIDLGPLESYIVMSTLLETKDVAESLKVAHRIVQFDLSSMQDMSVRLMALGAIERASNLIGLVKSGLESRDGDGDTGN